jgi:hypothetical protein
MSWKPRSGIYMDESYGLVYPEGIVKNLISFKILSSQKRGGPEGVPLD